MLALAAPTILALLLLLLFSDSATASAAQTLQAVLRPTATSSPLLSLSTAIIGANTGPSPLVVVPGREYLGCWNETTGFTVNGGARALGEGRYASDEYMTTSRCVAFCRSSDSSSSSDGGDTSASEPIQYAGLANGRECYCGAALSPLSERLEARARCTTACAGNARETCGGPRALTLYRLSPQGENPAVAAVEEMGRGEGADEKARESEGATAEESKTGIAWSRFAGAPTLYGILAAVTLVIAAVI